MRAHVAAGCAASALDADAADALVLAVDEVCANVVLHAYPGAPGPLTVDVAARSDGGCAVTIVDAGPAFDPTAAPTAPDVDAPVEARAVGGLGWFLVRRSIDSLHWSRTGEHNVVVLVRHAPPPTAPPAVPAPPA